MLKSTAFKVFLVFACLAAVLLAVFVARQGVLEILLTRALTDRGLVVQNLTVSRFDLDDLRLADLKLGSAGQLSIATLEVTFRPGELLDGEVRTVTVSGLRLTLDATGNGPPLGEFQSLLDGEAAPSEAPAIPQVRLRDGLLILETPLGEAKLAVSGGLTPETEEQALIELDLNLESEPARAEGLMAARLTADRALEGSLAVRGGEISLPQANLLGLTGSLDFTVREGVPQSLAGRFTAERLALTLDDLSPPAFRKAELEIAFDPEKLTLDGLLESESGAFRAELSGALAGTMEAPSFTLALTGAASHESLLWEAFALPKPAAGSHRIAFQSAGRLPPMNSLGDGLPLGDAQLMALLDGSTLQWWGEDLTYPGMLEGVNGSLFLQGKVADGELALSLQKDGVIEAAAVAPALEAAVGLPEALAPALPGPFKLVVKASGEDAFAARIEPSENPRHLTLTAAIATDGLWRGALDLAARLSLDVTPDGEPGAFEVTDFQMAARELELPQAKIGDLRAQGRLAGDAEGFAGRVALDAGFGKVTGATFQTTSLSAAVSIAFTGGTADLAVTVDEPGRVTVEGFRLPGQVSAAAPLVFEVAAGTFRHRVTEEPAGTRIEGSLDVALPAAGLFIEAGAQRRKAEIAGLDLTLELAGTAPGTLEIQGEAEIAALRLPGEEIVLEGTAISAAANRDLSQLHGVYRVAKIFQDTATPMITPLSLQGSLTRAGPAVSLAAQGSLAGIPDMLEVKAHHDMATGKGRLEAAFRPPAFSRDGLQPKDLFPAAAALEKARGQAQATARLDWSGGVLRGIGRSSIEDLSFDAEGIAVRGLSSAVAFADLLTGRSLPGQLLTIDKVDPGLPLSDISVRFQLDPKAPNGVLLEDGRFTLFSAQVTVAASPPTTPGAVQNLSFFVEGLELDQLFATIDAEGFSGSGQLAGVIPVALEADTLVIRNARLEATAPGRLQIRSAEAKALLEGGGEQATLLLEALEDFHYERLSMTLANSASNDMAATLSILGSNPAVLDGHPFQLNINLESNIGRVLAALRTGYRMSNQALQRLWRLRR